MDWLNEMLKRLQQKIPELQIYFNLPLFFLKLATISWLALGVLIVAPKIMSYLQLLLSRMREFDADRQAALLTGDPEGLAMALGKLEPGNRFPKREIMHPPKKVN
jgi:Zn-dependent protease with chaperone function